MPSKTCPFCHEKIDGSATTCPFCGEPVPGASSDPTVISGSSATTKTSESLLSGPTALLVMVGLVIAAFIACTLVSMLGMKMAATANRELRSLAEFAFDDSSVRTLLFLFMVPASLAFVREQSEKNTLLRVVCSFGVAVGMGYVAHVATKSSGIVSFRSYYFFMTIAAAVLVELPRRKMLLVAPLAAYIAFVLINQGFVFTLKTGGIPAEIGATFSNVLFEYMPRLYAVWFLFIGWRSLAIPMKHG